MTPKHVLGIDVAKVELVIFDTATKQLVTIPNTKEALELACHQYDWQPKNYQVGLESTGDYSLLPMKTLVTAGFKVRLLNPILTQAGIKRTVRGIKTDASDAQLIAELIAKGEGQLISGKSLDIGKKALIRLERKVTAMQSDLKRIRKGLAQKQSAGVPVEQAEQIIDQLLQDFKQTTGELWTAINDPSLANHLAQQEIIIGSHVGCGEKLSAIISAEAGNIKRFASARQLIAYAGLDPKVKQSGAQDLRGKMTKRGNSNLRHALFLSAYVASRHDPQLKAYYQKKRAEGKHHTVAVCAVARKMCERIYSTVSHNRLYEKREIVNELN